MLKKTALIFLIMSIVIILLPEVVPIDPNEINLSNGNRAPSSAHLLGTDLKGRDLFARMLFGTRLSFLIGISATFISLFVGVAWGSVAGYSGGFKDAAMMRIVDVLYGLPYMFIVIILMTITGRSVMLLFIALGLVQWLTMARIVRAEVISIKEKEFIEAAKAIGTPKAKILLKHILPNIIGTISVYATFTIPTVIIVETFLSFLGLGVQPPQASLGTLIKNGITTISVYPWQIIFPSLFLLVLVFTINRIGWKLEKNLFK
ncbi:MAG: ABC transporter permease [Spirochaetes bacterium]|nr:ABC transporter permease [Spirochaetota bacterium]